MPWWHIGSGAQVVMAATPRLHGAQATRRRSPGVPPAPIVANPRAPGVRSGLSRQPRPDRPARGRM